MIRGYQRVDFEFNPAKNKRKEPTPKKDDKDLFENLILEGSYLEYKPKHKSVTPTKSKDKNKQLQEIYNEFREFIDEDNKLFQVFIRNDMRKKKISS